MKSKKKLKDMTILRHLSVFLFSIIFFFIQGPKFVYNLWNHLFEGGDSFINSWILSWNAHALFQPNLSVWDAPIFYPVKNAFTFSEAMFGNLWITLPVQYLTDNSAFTANVLLISSFVFCTYFVFLLVFDLSRNYLAAFVAGILFSFTPYRWAHAGHLQLLPFFWAPIALLFANRFMEKPYKRYFYLMLSAVWFQYYASIYLGTMLLTMLIVLFFVHIVFERKGKDRWIYFRSRPLFITIISGVVLSLAILMPLGLPYLSTAKNWHFVRSLNENAFFSAEPLSLFLRPAGMFDNYNWLNGIFQGMVKAGEGAVFAGFIPWILFVSGIIIIYRRQKILSGSININAAKRYVWAAIILGVLMLGPFLIFFNKNTGIPLPYQIVYYLVPGAKAMRVPARLFQPFLLCMVVVGSYAVVALVHRFKTKPMYLKIIGVAILSIFISFDYNVSDNSGVLAETKKCFPKVYNYLANSDKSRPVLELPVGNPGGGMSSYKYLHYQSAHWRPTLGGMSGWYPFAREDLAKYLDHSPSKDALELINLTPAESIVIHLNNYPEKDRKLWEQIDPANYGFKNIGRIENAIVWERIPASTNQVCTKLSIAQTLWSIDKNNLCLRMLLEPAKKGKAWRYMHQGWSDVLITVKSGNGKTNKYTKTYKVPSFILTGRKATVVIPKIRGVDSNITQVQLGGSLLTENTTSLNNTGYNVLQTFGGNYITVESNKIKNLSITDKKQTGFHEYFEIINLNYDKVALKSTNGYFVCAEGGGGRELVANRNIIGEWEIFRLIKHDSHKVSFKAANGEYVSVCNNNKLFANTTVIGEREIFNLIEIPVNSRVKPPTSSGGDPKAMF